MSCGVKVSPTSIGKGAWSTAATAAAVPASVIAGAAAATSMQPITARRANSLFVEESVATIPTSASCPALSPAQIQQQSHGLQQQQQQQQQRSAKTGAAKRGEDTAKLLRYIDDNVVGKNCTFLGPFGRRKVVYCDYTATGRSLQFLEDYIVKEVLPYLGDTTVSTTICSLQSSLYRKEARDIVRHAVGAGEQDAVLFTGQGTAGALRTLLRHLKLGDSTCVFVGPFEHHANLRPWREHGIRLVRVDHTREGFLDLNDLDRKLTKERSENPNSTMIGYFSAASCVTGVLADDVATTLLLRQHGCLSFWDYTSAAPYIKMEMNPHLPGVGETTVHKDAIIFSGHKFIGGAQCPGILVVKRNLISKFMSLEDMRDSHRHLNDLELRDESSNDGVIEAIRCGLVVQLKENLTHQVIASRQEKISKQVLAHVRTIPELILLGCGSHNIKRLPIFSFMVRHPRGTYLHHNFVCAVLNDVFGVQARGGCACAGRYAHNLMGIDDRLAKRYENLLLVNEHNASKETSAESLRPGFARLTLPYFMTEAEVAFILEALKMVSTEGWKLLPQYVLDPETGEWRHLTNSVFKDRRWLGSVRYTDGRMNAAERRISGPGVFPQNHGDCLQTARNIFNRARKMAQRCPNQVERNVFFDDKSEDLRWFMLPHEAQDLLLGHSQNVKQSVPFSPSNYKLTILDSSQGFRRLNSDVPRSNNITAMLHSPRHRSLPALSCPSDIHKRYRSGSSKFEEDEDTVFHNHKSPNTSPVPLSPRVKFAVGEAVTTAAIGIFGSDSSVKSPVVTRLIGEEFLENLSRTCRTNGPKDHAISTDKNFENETSHPTRARCNSLGSSSSIRGHLLPSNKEGSSPVAIPLSPQTLACLGLTSVKGCEARHRPCSCNSQNDLDTSLDSDVDNACSPARSASSLGHIPTTSQGDSCSSSFDSTVIASRLDNSSCLLSSSLSNNSQDDLHAYLKEVTKELATEIKSEIREVTTLVDDALSESSVTDSNSTLVQLQAEKQQQQQDAVSASDVADYLMEFSKGMASEVKSEIRCMVNSVDGLSRYSPEEKSSSGCTSPTERQRAMFSSKSPLRARTPALQVTKAGKLFRQDSKMSSESSLDESIISCVNNSSSIVDKERGSNEKSAKCNTDDEDELSLRNEAQSRKNLPKIYSTVNSVSSQDSGINLSFQDGERSFENLFCPECSSAESKLSAHHNRRSHFASTMAAAEGNIFGAEKEDGSHSQSEDPATEDDEIFFSASHSNSNDEDNSGEDKEHLSDNHWYCPPKNIWKLAVRAMQEFDMIKDGDKVLLCLAPNGKSSLALLHTLHQYQFYSRSKGRDFEIGAVTVDVNGRAFDSTAYFESLNVSYFHELLPQGETSRKSAEASCSCLCEKVIRKKIFALAARCKYNVLALGHNLDDFIESFLESVFNNGQLSTLRAHYSIREKELRVVRPFVYIRQKTLKQFMDGKKLPILKDPAKKKSCQNKSGEIIKKVEVIHPRVYWSLRAAMHPLISTQTSVNEGADQFEAQPTTHLYDFKKYHADSFMIPSSDNAMINLLGSTMSTSLSKHLKLLERDEETDEDPTL